MNSITAILTELLTFLSSGTLLFIASFGIFIPVSIKPFIMSHQTDTIHPGERLFLLIFEPLINTLYLFVPLVLLLFPFYYYDFITYPAFAKCCVFLSVATYLNKDIAGGKSIGKRLLGYAVVQKNTETTPRKAVCFLRNLTILIYPAELIFALFSPTQKMSDYFTHTKIIQTIKEDQPLTSFYNDIKSITYNDETREVLGLTVLLFLFVLFIK